MFNSQTLLKKLSPTFNGVTYEIPEPKGDYNSRLQERLIFRNESTLYRRKCDVTGEEMVAIYPQDAPFPVYSPEVWFGDQWDARDYGMDFDFNRPFFEQFHELCNKVPHISRIFKNNVNSDYVNLVGDSKNCYLIYGSINCEDCYYGNPFNCKDCCDSLVLRNSELCLECTDSNKLYSCAHCQNCSNSRDLMFCYDVHSSSNCFGCVGLNRKSFHIFNQQVSESDYHDYLSKLDLTNPETFTAVQERFEKLKQDNFHRFMNGHSNENVTGESVYFSKNCENVYFSEKCEDVKDSFQIQSVTDCMDIDHAEFAELNYACMAMYDNVRLTRFCFLNWVNIEDLFYSGHCYQNVRHCFGSFGLKNAQYCILNKAYSPEEYEKIVAKIIEHMQKTGEWGQFFPHWISPFAYNESKASDYYPLSKEEVEAKGWRWKDDEGNKQFRIIPQEKRFYERFGLTLPTSHPKERHRRRVGLRNPMKLYDRTCAKTGAPIKTTFPPDGRENILCAEAYQSERF